MEPGEGSDEAALVERARSGDEDAFRALCERYEAKLRARIARRIHGALQRKVSLADVLQEAYITAHERLGDFEARGEGAFGAWLAKIAEYKAREAVRRYVGTDKRNAGREVTRGARPDTAQFRGRGPTPSEVAIGKEKRKSVEQALASLPDDYREILRLVQVEHCTLKDAAEVLGRSYEATKKLYGRALSRLADRLDEGQA